MPQALTVWLQAVNEPTWGKNVVIPTWRRTTVT
jgi:hypothetical protein